MRQNRRIANAALGSAAALAMGLGMTGCNNAGEGAFTGAALGALGGLAIGSLTGDAGKGATIGAVSGGLTGAVIGDQNQRNRQNARYGSYHRSHPPRTTRYDHHHYYHHTHTHTYSTYKRDPWWDDCGGW